MAVYLAPTDSIDAAYRRLVREMLVNNVFDEIKKNKFHVPKSEYKREIRKIWYKTKRKRAAARRKRSHKTI